MTPPKRLIDMAAPPGTAGPGPVGTDAIGTQQLEAASPEPRPAEGPEGQAESQNAILQALAAGQQQQQPMGGEPPQLTPQDEEMMKMRLALAAKQRLVGGLGG